MEIQLCFDKRFVGLIGCNSHRDRDEFSEVILAFSTVGIECKVQGC